MKNDDSAHSSKTRELRLLNMFNASLNHEGVFLADDVLMPSQLGNRISRYFEGLACSDIIGAHFVFKARIEGDEHSLRFFNALPMIRVHPNPAYLSLYALNHKFKRICPVVEPWPHEVVGGWSHRTNMIGEMLRNATNAVFEDAHKVTLPADSFAIIMPNDTAKVLPLVPTAAIMFRCVDILHWATPEYGYGFINFNVYKQLIPDDASHIYILSEDLRYGPRPANKEACTELSKFLVEYIHDQFPTAVVALRRGHVMESFAMMSHARTLVSAPSTFSLWGGMANPNRVYLMTSGERPLFKDKPFVHSEFMWLTSPEVIMGGDHASNLQPAETIAKLKEVFLRPLKAPVHFTTHVTKKSRTE